MTFGSIKSAAKLRACRIFRGDALSERVRRSLVTSLYTQPFNLAIGAITVVAASIYAAFISDDAYIWIGTIVLSLIAAGRVVTAMRFSPNDTWYSTRTLERLYEAGAFSYALMLGIITALCIWRNAPSAIQLLMLTNALCYSVGISARNAGRPLIAIGQLMLVTTPIFAALVSTGTVPYLILAMNLVLLVPAMASITINVFNTLRDSIGEAERSDQLAERMRSLARTDVVTGLTNRAGFNQDVIERLMEATDSDVLALFWIDLDRFKEVNDLLGHPIGDRVLQETAQRLEVVSPPDATIARFGGDEFIVFCEVTDRRHCERLASEIHAEIMRPFHVNGERIEVGASIGVAILPHDARDAEMLMQNADLALYHSKTNGRKQTSFYNKTMTRNLMRKHEIEAELREAIKKNELSIFFQPLVDLHTGKIRAFEALVRWFHPEKGELRPDEFIPVAEETGVIVTLGNWITAQAAKAAAKWPKNITLAVNLSSLQIRAPGSSLAILNALREAGLEPHRLELEITESHFLGDHFTTDAFIKDLSEKGVRFALDDFGTGYSSLSYIHQYPFTKIKIDRSFVSGPSAGPKTSAIIHAVAELGRKLDMEIVAEGIETVGHLEMARDAGCTLGQGYHFSRAVPDYVAQMLLNQENFVTQEPKRASA